MFVHHVTYRHRTGEREEFAGHGLTPAAALQNAVDTARLEITARARAPFSMARIDADACAGDARARARRNAQIAGRTYLRALN